MTRPSGRLALIVLAIVGLGGSASAQTTISSDEMLETLTSAAKAAPPGLTAAIIQQAVVQHMKENPGLPATRARLAVRLDDLAQINVQIQFALNSAIIRPESYATIGSIADALHHPILSQYRFVVTGNTDATGDRAANLKLSQARADAVVGALTTTFRVDPSRLEAVGLGEEALLDASKPDDPVNRRVQVINIGR
jgi:outer membrane protein OmpA-like peptidoglycan-associated protein